MAEYNKATAKSLVKQYYHEYIQLAQAYLIDHLFTFCLPRQEKSK